MVKWDAISSGIASIGPPARSIEVIRDIEGIFSSGQNGLFRYFFYSLVSRGPAL